MTETVGFIGLGTMGKSMATNLIKNGFPVLVRDINISPVQELVTLGAKEAINPKELSRQSTVVITMLYNDTVVREVALEKDGIIEGLTQNSVYIDMSTISPLTGALLSEETKKKGAAFLSAPVTRGPKAARDGDLTIMVGGNERVFERCRPVFEAMGEKIYHVGEAPELGYVFKLVNSLLSVTHGTIAAEAVAFGVKAGANLKTLFEVISDGSGNSYMFQSRVANMLKGNKEVLTLPIEGLFKDLETLTSYAKAIQMPLIFPIIAQQIHLDAMAHGLGKRDPSAFAELYDQRFNLRIYSKDGSQKIEE